MYTVCSKSVHTVLLKCPKCVFSKCTVYTVCSQNVHTVLSKCAHCALKVCTVCSRSVHSAQCAARKCLKVPPPPTVSNAPTLSTNSLQSATSQPTKSDLHVTREPKSASSPDIALILWLSCDLQIDVRIVMRIFTGILSAKMAVLISECLLYLLQQLKSVKATGRETKQGHKARRSRLAKS